MSCIIQPALLQTAFVTVRSVLGQIGLQGPDTPLRHVDTDAAWRPDFLPRPCWERTMANECFCLLCCSRGECSRKMCLQSPARAAQMFGAAHSVAWCGQDPSFLASAPDRVCPLYFNASRFSWLDVCCSLLPSLPYSLPSISLPRSPAHYTFPFLLSRTWLLAGLHLFILRTPSGLPWPLRLRRTLLPSTLCLYQV